MRAGRRAVYRYSHGRTATATDFNHCVRYGAGRFGGCWLPETATSATSARISTNLSAGERIIIELSRGCMIAATGRRSPALACLRHRLSQIATSFGCRRQLTIRFGREQTGNSAAPSLLFLADARHPQYGGKPLRDELAPLACAGWVRRTTGCNSGGFFVTTASRQR